MPRVSVVAVSRPLRNRRVVVAAALGRRSHFDPVGAVTAEIRTAFARVVDVAAAIPPPRRRAILAYGLAASATATFFFWEDVKGYVAGETADVAAKSLSSDTVKAEATSLVTYMVEDGPTVDRLQSLVVHLVLSEQSLTAVVGLLDKLLQDPRTTASVTQWLQQLLSQDALRDALWQAVKHALLPKRML